MNNLKRKLEGYTVDVAVCDRAIADESAALENLRFVNIMSTEASRIRQEEVNFISQKKDQLE